MFIPDGPGNLNRNPREVVVRKHGGGLQRLSELNGAVDPLHFVLLFPRGEYGWSLGIDGVGDASRNVTLREFISYHLMERKPVYNPILRGGMLFEEYLVTDFSQVEQQRLNFYRHHQDKLRVDTYNSAMEGLSQGLTGKGVGRRVILPTSFTGGPRYMNQMWRCLSLCTT